jgi:hypothetical protein
VSCAIFAESRSTAVGDLTTARMIVIVQYLQTSPVLRTRALAVFVRGSRIPNFKDSATVSFAATLDLGSIAADRIVGINQLSSRQALGSGVVFKAKASGGEVRAGKWLVSAPPPWSSSLITAALPGPAGNPAPPSGYVNATLTVAETSPPPKVLELLADFLSSKADDLSEALATALENL